MSESKRRLSLLRDRKAPVSAMLADGGPGPIMSMVSTTLRDARQRTEQTLPDVASTLRIRLPYLEAIEDGRFKDLPGVVYGIGFIRTYAEHLGLDAEDMVHRFKDEIAGAGNQTELHFPVPVPEGRVPGGAMLMLALLLAGASYGGWYYMSSQDRAITAMVPQLPDRLAALIDGDAQTAGTALPPQTASLTAADDRAAVAAGAPIATGMAPPSTLTRGPTVADPLSMPRPPFAIAGSAATTLPGSGFPVVSAPIAPFPAVSAPMLMGSAGPGALPLVKTPTSAPATPGITPTIDRPAAGPMTLPTQQTAQLALPSAAPEADVSTAPVSLPVANSRIIISATAQSWVQVRDATGRLIMTEVLDPGESYAVPDITGLSMVTGNAGGLQIAVDGKIVPPLGTTGDVVRDITLDPERLADGSATTR